jgi:transcriptional regulator GlxA family with amidase domain
MRLASPARQPEVGILLYAGCQMAMVHGMTDLLGVASDFSGNHGGARLRVSHWSLGPTGRIERAFDTCPDGSGLPRVIVVPGRLTGPMIGEEAAPYARWLHERHEGGATLAANCGGVFLMAATGLLSGRPATTHWLFAAMFSDHFPDVAMEPDKIVIDDGDLITAGGLMAWTDLALRLVERLLGPTVMVETGQFFLIDPAGREQRHYRSFAPRFDHGDDAILKVQHWLQARASQTIQVSEMANEARLGERTFLRRFKSATGIKPTGYLQQLRIGKARELLQFTRQPIDQVAWNIGYEDPAAFRRLFNRLIGLTPGEYRRRFGTNADLQVAA